MRDRLIELLSVPIYPKEGVDPAEVVADYLLDNGIIVPPCKVGDTVYMLVSKRAKLYLAPFTFVKKTKLTYQNMERVIRDFGKTVFLTREEAGKALKGDKDINVLCKTEKGR